MRYGLIGFLSAMVLAWTMATGGCGNDSDDGPTAGTGGITTTGGVVETGGIVTTGGVVETGGIITTGGVVDTGGITTTGGTSAGGGGGEANPVTTLSGTTTLSALNETQATQLCDDAYAYYRSAISVEISCKWKGLNYATSSSAPTEEQLRANCSDKEATCLADPGAALSNNSGCGAFPVNCAATVADYASCVMDQAAAFIQTVSGISNCDVLTTEGTNAVWDAMGATAPESCTFNSTCPGLYPPNPMY